MKIPHELFINHWKETHNKEGQLIETFEGKVRMVNFSEQKYLGFYLIRRWFKYD